MALRSRMGRRLVVVVSAVVAGLCLVAVGVFFAVQGLDRASKFGGVISVFVGLAGLGFSCYSIWRGRQAAGQPLDNLHSGEIQQQNSGGVNIANTGVTGDVDVRELGH